MTDSLPEGTEDYLRAIGLGVPLVERAMNIMSSIAKLLPEPVLHVSMNESKDEDGSPRYETLWLLSENYAAEAHDFVSSTHFDISSIANGIFRIVVQQEDFELGGSATEHSRLTVDIALTQVGSMGLTGTFKATGSNCPHLAEVVQSYLLPKLTESVESGT